MVITESKYTTHF